MSGVSSGPIFLDNNNDLPIPPPPQISPPAILPPSPSNGPDTPITRIYSYQNNDKILTLENSDPFINCLEQVHSFVDCCHDQFDPSRMSSFFKINKNETESLRDLIWFFSFGNTNKTEFKTNGHVFTKKNHIHKLAEALDRTPLKKFGFGITLPDATTTPETSCNYQLPELVELPWSDRKKVVNTFATYKYHNYTPANSAGAGAELRNLIGSSNSAYILDCGKRLFHENYTTDRNNENAKGKGISIFSGIIDSSTVNDPVLNITNCPGGVEKLQFLIPFIDIPGITTISMYCTFENYTEAIDPKTKDPKLFFAFLTRRNLV